ncbi:MAG TPA: MoaD/ThiS family protein [Mycobacteriales bacterium]|nr:MoaD/ThiS family protein [Mycobacteriales bacterium]
MVTVRYWAAARSAAGCVEETFPATTVAELVETISARHNMARIMKACSLLIDGVAASADQPNQAITDGSGVDVLPPFAGG